jgi:hypothetical protein
VDKALEDADARHKFEIQVLEDKHQQDLQVFCFVLFLKRGLFVILNKS